MNSRLFGLLLLAVVALAAAGCQQRSAQPAAQPTAEATEEMKMGGGQTIEVLTKEFAFEPNSITVNAGKVQFAVKNVGTVEHEFMIEGVTMHQEHGGESAIQPRATMTIEAELKPGTYEVTCNIPGHKEAGMVATLIVN